MKLITLTLAPAFDIHCQCDGFMSEHENLAHIISSDAGGKGVNISRALCVTGVDNTAIVVVGRENGASFLSALEADGIPTVPFAVEGRIRENITLHAEGQKETRISFPGFRVDEDTLQKVEETVYREIADDSAVLTLTGRLPDGMDIALVKDMISRLKARGVRVVVDSRSFTLADLIEVKPYLIKPNEEEIVTYMSRAVDTVTDAIDAAKELHSKGISVVMISLGGTGAVLSSDEGAFFVEAPEITAVSTIGAGDSSIAGFLAALKEGKSDKECLSRAVAYGSAACLSEGTKPPKKEDITGFLANGVLSHTYS